MANDVDVLVVGGGIIGLTAALAMTQRDVTVAILDTGTLSPPNDTAGGRVYAINHASQELFETLGIWSLINASDTSPYQHMHVWDAATKAAIHFDARMITKNTLGHIMTESVLKKALLTALKANPKVHFFPSTKINSVNELPEKISITDAKTTWSGQLLLVADGGQSPLRQNLGVTTTSWPYHQHALVTTVTTEKPHNKTAYQVFNQQGPLAFLPLSDSHECSIVWSTTPAHAKQLLTLEKPLFEYALTQAFDQTLGQVSLIGQRYQFPLVMRHAKQYVGQRWLLMGDAAHTIHPLAGLGLNLGLADVAAWLACTAASPRTLFSKKALGAYQRQRKYAVWQLITLLGGLKTLFANPMPPITTIRGLGLTICDHLTPLKRLLIEHAVGL